VNIIISATSSIVPWHSLLPTMEIDTDAANTKHIYTIVYQAHYLKPVEHWTDECLLFLFLVMVLIDWLASFCLALQKTCLDAFHDSHSAVQTRAWAVVSYDSSTSPKLGEFPTLFVDNQLNWAGVIQPVKHSNWVTPVQWNLLVRTLKNEDTCITWKVSKYPFPCKMNWKIRTPW